MKSAHEVLIEGRTSRILREAKQKQQDRLLAMANASLVMPATTVVLWLCFFGFVGLKGGLNDDMNFYIGPAVLFSFNLIHLFSVSHRRELALKELIREEVPPLHAKRESPKAIRVRREDGLAAAQNA